MYKNYDSLRIEIKIASNKNELATILNIPYKASRVDKTEFIEELAKSVDYAQSFKTNMMLLDDYNLNYLNIEYKESLDTILTTIQTRCH